MNRTLTVLVCIMVAGVVVGASLPIFDSLTASSESVHNDGAGWVRFTLDRNAGTEYTVFITEDENGVYVMNGDDVQTYDDSSTEDFETILYADSNVCVWWDSAACHVMGIKDGNPQYFEDVVEIAIVRDSSGVTITPVGYSPMTFGVPEWAYVPASAGNYGFFAYDEDRGVQNYPSNMPLAVVGGGFAGVYAYNDIYRYNGLGLRMNPIYQDDLFFGATWTKPVVPDDPVDPSSITLDPISFPNTPIIDIDNPFDPEPDASIMAVPTPTYTEGDWGYDVKTVNGVDVAYIVSYSGTGGDMVVPATIGGYDVYCLGKDESSANVFVNTDISSNSTLTISEGVVRIGSSAVYNTSKITAVSLPSTIEYIGPNAFWSCGMNDLVLPENITTIGNSAFRSLPNATGSLVLPDSLQLIDSNAFNSCKFTGSLVIPENTQVQGSAFYDCNKLSGDLIIKSGVRIGSGNVFWGCVGFDTVLIYPDVSITGSSSVFTAMSNTPNLILMTDGITNNNTFNGLTGLSEVLDLADNTDYSTTRYGINANATVSDTIGDCFGYISIMVIDGSGGSATQTLIAMLPLIMVLGLVLVAVGSVIWSRM